MERKAPNKQISVSRPQILVRKKSIKHDIPCYHKQRTINSFHPSFINLYNYQRSKRKGSQMIVIQLIHKKPNQQTLTFTTLKVTRKRQEKEKNEESNTDAAFLSFKQHQDIQYSLLYHTSQQCDMLSIDIHKILTPIKSAVLN